MTEKILTKMIPPEGYVQIVAGKKSFQQPDHIFFDGKKATRKSEQNDVLTYIFLPSFSRLYDVIVFSFYITSSLFFLRKYILWMLKAL